jgi:hypothetical protein
MKSGLEVSEKMRNGKDKNNWTLNIVTLTLSRWSLYIVCHNGHFMSCWSLYVMLVTVCHAGYFVLMATLCHTGHLMSRWLLHVCHFVTLITESLRVTTCGSCVDLDFIIVLLDTYRSKILEHRKSWIYMKQSLLHSW